ncbi:MAG: hypothetical protein RLZZ136_1222 [Pseudomonadota bacterium]|jgi:fructuronate reductase
MRLSAHTCERLGADVIRAGYDRDQQAVGIVHFGIGAFHRAHQAWYTDLAMQAGDRGWMITGVSLRSASVADQMNPQNGLYTLTEYASGGRATRLISAVRNVLVASETPETVIAALASPTTHIVSFTVTEKGYCRAADGSLDLALAGPLSLYRFVAEGLRRRYTSGLSGLTLLSCDNLADNGPQLQRLMTQYLAHHDPALLAWFEQNCTCPATMIDRIVPATTEDDRRMVAAALGLDDASAVMTEPFSQWVIEDRFAGPRPAWDKVGAQLVGDVAPYETAKLRMLNGAHSLLAYCGLQRGYSYVHEAVADPVLRQMIKGLMLQEAAPTIMAAPGQDLAVYASDLIERFANPALNHRLIQIAMDGSQKIPQRWLETLAANRVMGRSCPVILAGLAAWLAHIRGDNVAVWGPVDDPLAQALAQAWLETGAVGALERIFGSGGNIGSAWLPDEADQAAILAALV